MGPFFVKWGTKYQPLHVNDAYNYFMLDFIGFGHLVRLTNSEISYAIQFGAYYAHKVGVGLSLVPHCYS